MASTGLSANLAEAKRARQDEFYTQLSDIEKELRHYRKHFKGKVVYCNCDDPRVSNFFHYFSYNFEKLGLKKLIATCYKNQDVDLFSQHAEERAVYLEYEGDKDGDRIPGRHEIEVKPLQGDGDFRSRETIALLEQADIVVTNPPFSLFREYITQLVEHKKKFIVLANQNTLTTKDVFELVSGDKLWLGYNNGDMAFRVPDHYEPRDTRFWIDDDGQKWRSFGTMCWLTNLDIAKRHEELILFKTYTPEEYPAYDNFDAIEVGRVADIPIDFEGVMGVPPGFLAKHNPDQFEIVGITTSYGGQQSKRYPKQVQVNPDGSTKTVGKLNDAPAMRVMTPPVGKAYYKIGDEMFVLRFHRILIRRKEATS